MKKLGLQPRNSFTGNILMGFSLQCVLDANMKGSVLLSSTRTGHIQHIGAFFLNQYLFSNGEYILSINKGSLFHATKCKMRLPLAQVETPTPGPSLNSWSSDSWRLTETRPRSSGGILFLCTARNATSLESNPYNINFKIPGCIVEHRIKMKENNCHISKSPFSFR
jgi:hypothetical protein